MSDFNPRPAVPTFGQIFSDYPKNEEKTPGTKFLTSSQVSSRKVWLARESQVLASCTRIVPEGDLILEVSIGATSKYFLVASQVLVSTSAVFAKMLGKKSNFAEAVALRESKGKDQPVIVKVEDDDPPMMELILYALHLQYKRVPDSIPLSMLFKAAIICDKYALHEALRLIAKVWSDPLKNEANESPREWLFISWVLGPESVFTEVSKQLILDGSSNLDNEDELVFGEGKLTLHECVPSAVSC
jgi:hypothetical protein